MNKANPRAIVLFVAASAALASSGCHEDNLVVNHQSDNNYIRLPGEKEAKIKIGPGSLFPLQAGDHWENVVQNKNEKGTEQVVVNGTINIGGLAGVIVETHQNGKIVREEVYHTDARGDVSLMAMTTGTKDNLLTMSPPIPLFDGRATDGTEKSWSGIMHFKDTSSTGSALSRISGRETVLTAAGKFDTFRTDSLIVTTIGGQMAPVFTRRWLAPGVGVVQSVLITG